MNPPLLKGRNLVLYYLGIGSLVVGVLALFVLGYLVFAHYYADFLTFDGALAAIGATLGAISTTFAAIGSALLFVVSLRVQARELQHSIEELKKSVEAQKDAAVSQKEMLNVTKQERHFSISHRAIEDLSISIYNYDENDKNSAFWIQKSGSIWLNQFLPDKLESLINKAKTREYSQSNCFAGYNKIDELVLRMEWISRSLQRPELVADDRAYLIVLFEPLRQEVYSRLAHVFGGMNRTFDRVLAHPNVNSDKRLQEWLSGQFQILENLKERLLVLRLSQVT